MVITIQIWFDLTRFRKDFSECTFGLCMEAVLEKLQRSGVQPSERLMSLGVMEDQLWDPLKPLEHHGTMVSRGLGGGWGASIGTPLCRGMFFSGFWLVNVVKVY